MKTLKLEKKDKLVVLTINRPESLNALNSEVISDLETFIESVKNDKNIRVIILTGSGEKAFVAGADIKEISTLNKSSSLEFALRGQKVFSLLEEIPQVVIGAINGFALGGGLELALACDFLIASKNAKLGLPEVTLGLIPGFGGTQRLSRAIGPARAKQMIFSAQHITADEAYACGLVNQVVEQNVLLETCEQIALKIIKNSSLGIYHSKRAINKGFNLELNLALQLEAELFQGVFESSEQKEGVQAFLEKRKPNF